MEHSATSTRAILAPLDEHTLVASGLAGPVSVNGTRRVHKRRLHRSSDKENEDVPLVNVQSPAADTLGAFVELPSSLISEATLRYIGYDHATASRIWYRWTHWPTGPPVRETDDSEDGMPFIEVAKGYLVARGDDTADEDDTAWREYLNVCGISQSTQDAIMDPIYRCIRLTESCLFWIEDTMETRYKTLESIQRTSRERAMALSRASSRPPGSTSTTSQSVGSSSQGGRRSISSTQRQEPGIEVDTAMSALALAAQNAPGFTVLWKGMSQQSINGLFDDHGNVVNIVDLVSSGRTDFCRGVAYYFAMDREVAVYYANYAKRRTDASSAVLVRVAIPNSAIEGLSDTERLTVYWPSDEWKELVFRCRRGLAYTSRTRKFRDAVVIIGSIATKPTIIFERMDSPSEITESMVGRNAAGQLAVQYAWPQESGEDFLTEHAAPRLKVYGLTREEHESWEAGHEV